MTIRSPKGTLTFPRTIVLLLFSVTLFAPVFDRETAPVRALVWSSVIALCVAANREVPPTESVVLATWVMSPVVDTARFPVATLTLPRDKAPGIGQGDGSRSRVRQRDVAVEDVGLVEVGIAPFVAVKVASPPMVKVVVGAWVMFPAAVTTTDLPDDHVAPSQNKCLVVVQRDIVRSRVRSGRRHPLNALAWFSVILMPVVVLKLDVPPTVRVVLAACVMFPVAEIARLPAATLLVPRTTSPV